MALRLIVPPDEKMVPSLIHSEMVEGSRPPIRENEREKSPGFTGTEFQAQQIAELIALGMGVKEISSVLRISPALLQFYYKHEFDTSEALVNARVAKVALDFATSGRNPEMTQYWLNTRAGWMQKSRVELTGADGGPVEMEAVRSSLMKVIENHETVRPALIESVVKKGDDGSEAPGES